MRPRFERLRTIALAVVSVVFTAIGVAMAAHPRGPQDRLAGITGAVFFGAAGWIVVMKDRVGRGLRARPSPTLRVGSGPARPDRLAFGAGRERLAYLIAGLAFFGAGAATGFGMIGGLEGAVVGTGSVLFVVASLFGIAASFAGPFIVFERDHVAYRWVPRGWRRVPYADLASGDAVTTSAGAYCILHLRDPEGFLASQPDAVRREFARNVRHFGAPIVLPNGVDPNAEQLLHLVAQYATWEDAASPFPGDVAPAIPRGARGAFE